MKRFFTAVALVCVLSTAVFAGDIPTVDFTPPPPPPPPPAQSSSKATGTTLGDIPTADGAISLIEMIFAQMMGRLAR